MLKATIGKREIKKAKVLEESHSDDIEIIETKTVTKKTTKSNRESKVKKNVKTVRFTDEEHSKIEKYLKKNDIYFSDLVRDLLESEEIF